MPKTEASGTLTLVTPDPHLGGAAEFTVTTTGWPAGADARVQVLAYQDGAVVYGEAGPADQAFLLGGGSSQWRANGGPAHCVATLYYWQFHPRQIFHPFATVEFDASGV